MIKIVFLFFQLVEEEGDDETEGDLNLTQSIQGSKIAPLDGERDGSDDVNEDGQRQQPKDQIGPPEAPRHGSGLIHRLDGDDPEPMVDEVAQGVEHEDQAAEGSEPLKDRGNPLHRRHQQAS